jgi:molybdate transport system substrate-binding protein
VACPTTRGEKLFRTLAFFVLLLGASATVAEEITAAAAADLSTALPDIAAKYKAGTGQDVKLTFGSSGNLTTQIRNGAPFDVFFSAGEDYPKQLIAENLADKDTLFRYAVGRLVLWIPNSVSLEVEKLGFQTLLDPAVKKISIANPQHAPYGRAAEAALKHAGVYDQTAAKFVLGENVSQAAQFVESGNAQAGLIALSHALSPALKDKGHYWQVPLDNYPTLYQAAVVLTRTKQADAARRFLAFVRGAEGRDVLKKYGFSLPEETH